MTAAAHSHKGNTLREDRVFDFLAVGFGPSNLALAVAAKEIDPSKKGIVFEAKSAFDWHPGILFDDSRMQISFLKDLATLRNPASPYTFLQYTKAKGRLERFVNLREFHPTRLEYQDYLRWVAEAFADQVRYNSLVRQVTPVCLDGDSRPSLFRVEVLSTDTQEVTVYWAPNVVYAAGGKPRVPADAIPLASKIIHSSEFLKRFPHYFTEHARAYEFAVVGNGQSAGEIVANLLHIYPKAHVHLFVSGYAPRPADNSPFVNEAFFSDEAEAFYQSSEAKRRALRTELRNTNYGVIDPAVINELYRSAYLDEVKGEQRLFIHRFSRLVSAEESGEGVKVTIGENCSGKVRMLECDALVLATGYHRCLDEAIFKDLLPLIEKNGAGEVALSRNYQVRMTEEMDCKLYVQGYGESSHGLGDTLLSLLPFRSKEIFEDICQRTAAATRCQGSIGAATKGLRGEAEYPPKRHLEHDPEKLYLVLERYKFATLISVLASGEPIVTHVPLILDRTRGDKGILFGHMDRANPHADVLEGGQVLAIFHGPNSYISPHVYETNQLPTWNSIAVHLWGRAQVLRDKQALVKGLMRICEQSDKRPGAYRLNADDPRIERLIDFIVGFEITIDKMIGRFKLSQDRADSDRRLAALELVRHTEAGERTLIEEVLGYRL